MNGWGLWLGLAGGEVALLVFVLLLAYWIRHSRAARRDRQAVASLVQRARKDKSRREAEVERFLSEGMGLSGRELEREKVGILRQEYQLLQTFADIYAGHDAGRAAQFHISVEAATGPYLALRAAGAGTAGAEGPANDELEALRQENARLSEELSVTMDTMGRMLSEYSSMVAGGPEASTAAASEPQTMESLAEREGAVLDETELDIAEARPSEDDTPDTGEHEAVDDATQAGGSSVSEDAPAQAGAADPTDALDDLFDGDPLEEGLGELFDEEDMAVLEEADAGASEAQASEASAVADKDDAIAI